MKNAAFISSVLENALKVYFHCIVELTLFLFRFFVAGWKAYRHTSMQNIAVSITSMAKERLQHLWILIQDNCLFKIHQVLSASLIVTSENVLH